MRKNRSSTARPNTGKPIKGPTDSESSARGADICFRQALAELPIEAVRVLVAMHAQMTYHGTYLGVPKTVYSGGDMWEATEQIIPVMEGSEQIDTRRGLRLTCHKDHGAVSQAEIDRGLCESELCRYLNRIKSLEKARAAESSPELLVQYGDQLADAQAKQAGFTQKLKDAKRVIAERADVIYEWPLEECI